MIFIELRNFVVFVKGLDIVMSMNNICSLVKWGERDEFDLFFGIFCGN